MGKLNSTYRHHLSHIPVTEWIAEIPKHRQLHGVCIKTVVAILSIGVGGEERVAILTLKGLISRWSGAVFNEILALTMGTRIHGAIFG